MNIFAGKFNNDEKVIELYNNIDSDIVKPNYLNFGFWKNSNTTINACEAMVNIVISNAEIKNNSTVLDVGFGYGFQDILISNQFQNLKITAINIVQKQIDCAKEIFKSYNLKNKIEVFNLSATKLDTFFEKETYDRIISIESAIHFDTREEFYRQAYKVLKPNGIICLTDATQNLDELKNYKGLANTLSFLAIPEQNIIDERGYIKMITDIGFKDVEFINITEYVIPYISSIIYSGRHWRTDEIIKLPLDKNKLNDYMSKFKENVLYHNYFIIKAIK